MAQTIMMQDYALQDAQRPIEELERQQAERPAGGSLLSGFFGGSRKAGRPAGSVPAGLQEFAARVSDESKRWREVVKTSGAKVE